MTSAARWLLAGLLASSAPALSHAQTQAPTSGAEATPAVALTGSFIDFLQANPSGGVETGWGNTAQLQVGADVDLERLVGWSGAKVHVRESVFGLKRNAVLDPGAAPPGTLEGHFFAQNVGSTLGGAPFPNFIPDTYLSHLSLEQQLGSRLTIEVGRMNPMTAFDTPSNCENILSCQNPIVLYDNLTLPPAFATWGGRAQVKLTSGDSLQVGVYEDHFSLNTTDGFDWSLKGRSGWFYVGEFSHHEDFATARKPFSYTLGAFYDTSSFSDPLTRAAQEGSAGIYGRAQKVLWTRGAVAGQHPQQHVTGFATAGYGFGGAQPYETYVELGANYHGLWKSRPHDHVGAKLAYLRIRDHELEAERLTRLTLTGVDARGDNNQFRAELNAHIQLRPGMALEPVAQYIVNPNVQFSNPLVGTRAPKDGVVLGLVLHVDFQALR